MKKTFNKKSIIIAAIILAVIISGVYFLNSKKAPRQIYEVAIMVRSQENPDKAEDRKTSLKKGDVLVVQKDGHNWSKTEEISYLILKMDLTEEQAQMLSQAKTREIEYKELSDEEKARIDEEKKRAEEAGEEYREEPRTETLVTREYRVDLSGFEGFKAVDLISGQPFLDEVYGWGIVEKKK